MFNAILIFVLLSLGVGVAIYALRQMSSDERWATIKYLSYGLGCGIIALVVLAAIVFVF